MQAHDIKQKIEKTLARLTPDEQNIYRSACARFSENRTYQITPEPLRSSLQHDYGTFNVERYIKEKRINRLFALNPI
jgi:hypothetical protein